MGVTFPDSWDTLHAPACAPGLLWPSVAGGVNGVAGGIPNSGADAVRSGSGAAGPSGAAAVSSGAATGVSSEVSDASAADSVGSGLTCADGDSERVSDVVAEGDAEGVALTDADGDCVADCSSFAVSSPPPQADKNNTAARPVAIMTGRVPVRELWGASVILLMATVSYFSGRIAARITCAR
ncbi:hypothetical protein GCM10009824_20430 [Kocuria atrinae]|uniref:Uncharacterized protein n=1 Tax=Kocuria atrinae TaxID=592377 RepID=A0ABP5JKY9_9MICC